MSRAIRFATLALAAAVAACGSDGPVREPADLTAIEDAKVRPGVLWDASPGNGDGEQDARLRLALEPDLLVTADADGDVYALDPATGKRKWHASTDARVVSGPSLHGDLVLLGTLDAEVIALKRADGSPAWRSTVSSEVLAPPVGDGGVILVRCGDGKVFGLSAESGVRRWNFDRAVPPLTLRGLSAPLIHEGVAIIGLDNGRAAALKVETGQVLWEEVVSAPEGRSELERIVDVDADLLVAGGGVFALSFGGELAAIALQEGRVAWRRSVKSYTGATLMNKRLLVSDEAGVVWALDAETGAAMWKQEALKYRRLSAPVEVDGHAVVADYEGYLHWLSPDDGRIVGRVRAVGGAVVAAPIVQGDRLYVLDRSGEIAVVEPKAVN
ncbi:MAG: outer membrane protein assembly factor BamB [Gammaproteobacteria bacterium]